MTEMAEWIRRLAGLVLLLGFAELLLPPGETSRFARLVIGFSLLLSLLQPLTGLLQGWRGGTVSLELLGEPLLPPGGGGETWLLRQGGSPPAAAGPDSSFDEAADRGRLLVRRALERVIREARQAGETGSPGAPQQGEPGAEPGAAGGGRHPGGGGG